jgi:hypothetical protein
MTSVPLTIRFLRRMIWQRLQPRRANYALSSHGPFDMPPRFGEIIAASTIPDFAGLPIEWWPGYRSYAATNEVEDASPWAAQPRLVRRND